MNQLSQVEKYPDKSFSSGILSPAVGIDETTGSEDGMVWEQIQKRRTGLQLLVAGLGILLALILFVDIGVAIGTGTYLTRQPTLAPYVGRWIFLFIIRQVDIFSPQVEWLFLGWAGLWLITVVLYLWKPVRMWLPTILIALLSFWYFPIGSWIGVAIIILLAWIRVQQRES